LVTDEEFFPVEGLVFEMLRYVVSSYEIKCKSFLGEGMLKPFEFT